MVTEADPPSTPEDPEPSQPQPDDLATATQKLKVALALERIVGEEAGVLKRLKEA